MDSPWADSVQVRVPPRLRSGDGVRVIAPSRSLALIDERQRELAAGRLAALGLEVSFGRHALGRDEFDSTSVEARLADLAEAFADPAVHAILTAIGGCNANQLLRHLPFELIAAHPKVLCGYSDVTVLLNAITARTGLTTYHGPHFATFGMPGGNGYTEERFRACLFDGGPLAVRPAEAWSGDRWWEAGPCRYLANPGPFAITAGEAEGRVFGGDLSSLALLHGTGLLPPLGGALLLLESAAINGRRTLWHFGRLLQALVHQPGFERVRGLAIGRFPVEAEVEPRHLVELVRRHPELRRVPVAAGFDFGHTSPQITFPIGGRAALRCGPSSVELELLEH
jgi:muramoyltetrapeptide carboxypeptidase